MMKKAILFELKRGFRSSGFLVSCLIGVAICILDLVVFCKVFWLDLNEKIVLQVWIGTDYQLAFNNLYYVLLPILAALPFGASYYQDLKTGYVKNVCIKISRKEYFAAKSIATFLSAQVAVMMPLLFNLILSMGIVPLRVPEKLTFLNAGILDRSLFAKIFYTTPLLYCILFILLDGLFAGILSLYSICIAEWVESAFSAIATPFVVYIISGVALMGDENGNWSVMEMVNPMQRCTSRIEQLLICIVGGIVIAAIGIILKGRKKDFL